MDPTAKAAFPRFCRGNNNLLPASERKTNIAAEILRQKLLFRDFAAGTIIFPPVIGNGNNEKRSFLSFSWLSKK